MRTSYLAGCALSCVLLLRLPTSQAECTDSRTECSHWASIGECAKNPSYMHESCRKSCKVCECGDVQPKCQQWAKGGECRANPNYMLEHCKKSCGVCDCVDQHDLCKTWSKMGECVANPNYMLANCRRSCRQCSAEALGPCIDQQLDCWQLTAKGECMKSPEIRAKCPETCYVCGEGDPCILNAEDPGHFSNTPHPYNGTIDAMFHRIVSDASMQQLGVRTLSKDPWVIVFDDFLNDTEVDLLTQAVDGGWERSKAGGIEHAVKEVRTSDQVWCKDSCSFSFGNQLLRGRVEQITGVPSSRYEETQMLRYQPGQFYKPHVDWIGEHNRMACGPRLLTFFAYLSDSPGADTHFPQLNLSVPARRGTAALWHNVLRDNIWEQEERTEHQGLPAKSSTKYAANVWIHQYDFVVYSNQHCLTAARKLVYRKPSGEPVSGKLVKPSAQHEDL